MARTINTEVEPLPPRKNQQRTPNPPSAMSSPISSPPSTKDGRAFDALKEKFRAEMAPSKRSTPEERTEWCKTNIDLQCAQCSARNIACETDEDRPACAACARGKRACSRTIAERADRARRVLKVDRATGERLLSWYEQSKDLPPPMGSSISAARKRKRDDAGSDMSLTPPPPSEPRAKRPSAPKPRPKARKSAPAAMKNPFRVVTKKRRSRSSDSDGGEDDLNLNATPRRNGSASRLRRKQPNGEPDAREEVADFIQLHLISRTLRSSRSDYAAGRISSRELVAGVDDALRMIDELARQKLDYAAELPEEVEEIVENLRYGGNEAPVRRPKAVSVATSTRADTGVVEDVNTAGSSPPPSVPAINGPVAVNEEDTNANGSA